MPKAILAIASLALTIFALADCIQTEEDRVRGIPRWAWIILVVLVPWAGPITWLLVGKDRSDGGGARNAAGGFGGFGDNGPAAGGPRRGGPRRPVAPDEDPDFLRKLDEDIRRERRERDRREQDGENGDG